MLHVSHIENVQTVRSFSKVSLTIMLHTCSSARTRTATLFTSHPSSSTISPNGCFQFYKKEEMPCRFLLKISVSPMHKRAFSSLLFKRID